MTLGEPPGAVLFDVNETLFPIDQLAPAFASAGLDPATVPLWFAGLLRDGIALAAMGGYRPFAELAADALRELAPDLDGAAVDRVLAGFRSLPPHPDVAPALRLLHDAGIPAATLTNGSAEVTRTLLERAGLAGYLREILSVDAVARWKPAPEPYAYAAARLDLPPHRVALVAAHPWDCAGAQAAGLRAGWLNRTGRPWPRSLPPPAATGPDLPGLVTALLHDYR